MVTVGTLFRVASIFTHLGMMAHLHGHHQVSYSHQQNHYPITSLTMQHLCYVSTAHSQRSSVSPLIIYVYMPGHNPDQAFL